MESPITIWNQCLNIIRNQINNDAFDAWFSPIIPLKQKDNNFTIQVPSHFFYEYLDEKYAKLILQSLSKVTDKPLQLSYIIVANNAANSQQRNQEFPISSIPEKKWNSHLNKRQTFDTFFKSDSNKIVYGIAQKIINEPGKDFNPCFFYGKTGVGKTHLCHATGNEIERIYPRKKVLYTSAHWFQVQFTDASREKKQNEFIRFYQQIDVLILDDIHELSGKEKTLQAYFHLFNHLHQLGKQLILTADKTPIEIEGLEERLTSRLKWGLTMEMQPPDVKLRKKILQHKIQQNGLTIPEKIINYISEVVTENVRDLEGIITSLVGHSLIEGYKTDLNLIQKKIDEIVKKNNKKVTLEKIQQTVSSYFKITPDQLLSKSRKQEIVQARQIAMFLSKKHMDYTYKQIGQHIGHRDHATALHACRIIQNKLNNKGFRLTMDEIERLIFQ